MDPNTRTKFDHLYSEETNTRYEAYLYLMKLTKQPVGWAYEVWDDLLLMLKHKNNHLRAIASQLLSQLAKSDPERRMEQDFEQVAAVTYDGRFVTARHTLQSLWKIAVCNSELESIVVLFLRERFADSISEKNCTLIRYDIVQALRNVYDYKQDPVIKETALQLIQQETSGKYNKKYMGVWKDILK